MLRVPAAAPSASASASSSSSPPPEVMKKLVGGSWRGSPATTARSARISAPTASAGVTWDASSKMTTSKHRSAGSSWETSSGDIAQHGRSAPRTWGAAWNSWRTGRGARLRRGRGSVNPGFSRGGSPGAGGVLGHGSPDPDRGGVDVGTVRDTELSDGTKMGLTVEGAHARVCDRHRVENRRQPYVLSAGKGQVSAEMTVVDFLDERAEAGATQRGAEPCQFGQLVQRLGVGEQGLQAGVELGDRQLIQAGGAGPPGQGPHLGAQLPEGTFGAGQVGGQMRQSAVDRGLAPGGSLPGRSCDRCVQGGRFGLARPPQAQ